MVAEFDLFSPDFVIQEFFMNSNMLHDHEITSVQIVNDKLFLSFDNYYMFEKSFYRSENAYNKFKNFKKCTVEISFVPGDYRFENAVETSKILKGKWSRDKSVYKEKSENIIYSLENYSFENHKLEFLSMSIGNDLEIELDNRNSKYDTLKISVMANTVKFIWE